MGLGPSIKMTTLHHFRCPLTQVLSEDKDLDFMGIIVDGVSEVCDDKIYTAKRTADIAKILRADAAIVAIDGWGNHHVDFVNVIEQLGIRGIKSVGLSYIGLQGRLVCSSPYVDCVVDFNKSASGYESCVVGENNLMRYDAVKATALLKNKLKKSGKLPRNGEEERIVGRLTRKVFEIKEVRFGDATGIAGGVLTLNKDLVKGMEALEPDIERIYLNILSPGENDFFVNSNLDYAPIACKVRGEIGEGITHLLSGVCVMLTGVEKESGFQPSNIGSSEGIFKNQVVLDREGTPRKEDYIIHVDVLFKNGMGRTAQGIYAAHRIADRLVEKIRVHLKSLDNMPYKREELYNLERPGKSKVVLVKIVSGLGNMYDTAMFPNEPGGVLGARNMMDSKNLPYLITANQCRDGAIHSLL